MSQSNLKRVLGRAGQGQLLADESKATSREHGGKQPSRDVRDALNSRLCAAGQVLCLP